MQSFTRTEISWIAKEMKTSSERMKNLSELAAATSAERELCRLKSEQFAGIAEKLNIAVEKRDRRIEIKQI